MKDTFDHCLLQQGPLLWLKQAIVFYYITNRKFKRGFFMAEGGSYVLEATFISLILTLSSSAWVALGKIAEPVSGEIKKDLRGAKLTIDILMMLRDKTKGNLSSDEEKILNAVISDLQGNYAETVFEERKAGEAAAGVSTPTGPQAQGPEEPSKEAKEEPSKVEEEPSKEAEEEPSREAAEEPEARSVMGESPTGEAPGSAPAGDALKEGETREGQAVKDKAKKKKK